MIEKYDEIGSDYHLLGKKMSKILIVDDDPHIRELAGCFYGTKALRS